MQIKQRLSQNQNIINVLSKICKLVVSSSKDVVNSGN